MKVLDKALAQINQRRLQAERQARENKIKALSNKEFAKAYSDYIDDVIKSAKGEKLDRELEKSKKYLDTLLKNMNIGAIEPKYFCPHCNDSGFVDGKRCECLKHEINKLLVAESRFGELVDFKNVKFDIFENPENMKKIYTLLQAWCNSDFKKNTVYLSGDTGTGKTYLLKCMANELIKRGKLTLLVTSFKLGQDCLKSYACKNVDEKDSLISKYLECEVLFIDDLGTEVNLSPITINYLYTVLNERKMRNLPTVITTNLSLDDLPDVYDERITSRIADASTIKIQFKGKDLRLKK